MVFLLLLQGTGVLAQIDVQQGQTATELARRLAGQGVTLLNPQLHCQVQAYGTFTAHNSNLGLDSGIVLTSGRAATIPGFYGVNGPSDALASMDNGAPGDSMLTILAGQNTKDACILEFDLVPASDTISIDYVFSSEEYLNAVCGPYNDVFAFFISGPGISGSYNMARVPGTNIPVTINSINNGVPGTEGIIDSCTIMGPGSPFTMWYNDNASGTTLTHRGMTKVLRAMHVVTPCLTYHLRIAIADAGNAKYDSGVFLEAGSLKAGGYHITTVSNSDHGAICVKGCLPGRFRVTAEKTRPVPVTLHYLVRGTAVAGVDYAPIVDSVVLPANAGSTDIVVNGLPTALNGVRTIQLVLLSPILCNSGVMAADSAWLPIHDTITVAAMPRDTLVCRGDSVLLRAIGDTICAYRWLPDAGLDVPVAMQTMAAPFITTIYTVSAFIPGSTCPVHTASTVVYIRLTPEPVMPADTQVCYNATFVLGSGTGPGPYAYSWSGPAGITATTQWLTVPDADTVNAGIYTVLVTNDTNGCAASAVANVFVYVPPLPAVVTPAYYCVQHASFPIPAPPQTNWYDKLENVLSSAPTPPTDQVGDMLYYASASVGGCESRLLPVPVRVERCCDGGIFVPTAFTPNNDGLNDRFSPHPDFSYTIKLLEIFDRWGRVVYSGGAASWDGTSAGEACEAGTYYYRLLLGCKLGGTILHTGDVTLIR